MVEGDAQSSTMLDVREDDGGEQNNDALMRDSVVKVLDLS